MAENTIITIGRSFGSNGRIIGEKVAKSLGIGFYDRNLLEKAAKESNIDWKLAGSADEKLIGGLLKFGSGFEWMQENPNDRIYQAQKIFIRNLVKNEESCVIVGRGADYILRKHPEVLKVYIYAPLHARIETIMERYHFSQKEAEKAIKYMDKQRKNYYEYFTDGNWDQKEGKNLLIDSSLFGVKGSVRLIQEAAEYMMSRGR